MPVATTLGPVGILPPGRAPARSGTVEVWFAGALCVLAGARFPRYEEIFAIAVIAVLLIPLWLPALSRYRGARLAVGLGVLAVVSGITLTGLAASDHTTSERLLIMTSARILGIVVLIGLLLWARLRLGAPLVGVLFALGMLAVLPLQGFEALNPWKFSLSVPIAILLLGLSWLLGRRWLDIVALIGLVGVSALNDSRSAAAMFALAAAVVAMQRIRLFEGRRRVWWALGRLGIIGYLVFLLAQAAILEGYLGVSTQQRTQAQLELTGSVILGGRPELGASVALLTQQPWGYGSGTTPSMFDVLVAKSGMASLGYDPNNGYVERYMLSPSYEVHSILGDVWILYGALGLVWLLITMGFVFYGVAFRLTARRISGLEVFLATRMVWDLFFSPLYSSVSTVILFIVVVLVRRAGPTRVAAPRRLTS